MEEYQTFDPEGVMRHITRHTHYMPKHWRGAENTESVRSEFEALFQVMTIQALGDTFLLFCILCVLFALIPLINNK